MPLRACRLRSCPSLAFPFAPRWLLALRAAAQLPALLAFPIVPTLLPRGQRGVKVRRLGG
eukprot:9487378-Pyramimonas_sp.AAC.2